MSREITAEFTADTGGRDDGAVDGLTFFFSRRRGRRGRGGDSIIGRTLSRRRRARLGFFGRISKTLGFDKLAKKVSSKRKAYNKECWYHAPYYTALGFSVGNFSIAGKGDVKFKGNTLRAPTGTYRSMQNACARYKSYDGEMSMLRCKVTLYQKDINGACSQCHRRGKVKGWCYKGVAYDSQDKWDLARMNDKIRKGLLDPKLDGLLPYYDDDDDGKLSWYELEQAYKDIGDALDDQRTNTATLRDRHCALDGEACGCSPKAQITVGYADPRMGTLDPARPHSTIPVDASGSTLCAISSLPQDDRVRVNVLTATKMHPVLGALTPVDEIGRCFCSAIPDRRPPSARFSQNLLATAGWGFYGSVGSGTRL